MASETTTSTPNWTALQGRILDGGYEISECLLTSSESASFRIRVLGDRSMQAVVNVFRPEAAPLEQYLLWQEALELRHPNISTPISVGRLDWENSSYPYVVLYKADENLGGIVTERALTPAEMREVIRNVGAGLEYLHANGFVHSALAPEHVLALGDAIKISSTTIRRINTPIEEVEPEAAYKAPESAGDNVTVPADIWCLGATVFEALTQKKCSEDCREQAKTLPDPFDWLVERCLDPEPHERPSLSEVFAILSGGLKRPEPEPEAVAPEPQEAPAMAAAAGAAGTATTETAGSAASPGPETTGAASVPTAGTASTPAAAASSVAMPVAEPRQAAAPSQTARPSYSPPREIPPRSVRNPQSAQRPPIRPAEPPRPKLTTTPKPVYTENRPRIRERAEEKSEESPRVKFLSYAFLAIVLAGGLLWLARPKPDKSHLTTVNPATPAARTHTVPPESASPAGTPPAPGAVTSSQAATAARTGAPGAAVSTPSAGAGSWRVVVFTFAHQQDAERQAQALNSKHPGFDPQVFAAGGNGKGPYLIVLGGPMTREEANRTRDRARSAGFPRDAYIQNFNH